MQNDKLMILVKISLLKRKLVKQMKISLLIENLYMEIINRLNNKV